MKMIPRINYSKLSDLSYDGIWDQPGYTIIEISSDDTQAYIMYNVREVVVVFRGSDSFADAITDVKVRKKKNIHRGFLFEFMKIRKQLKKAIDKIYINQPIVFTGHSLGGSLAVLAAHFYNYNSTLSVITYGAPQVGDDVFQFIYRFDQCTTHYSYRFDPVPRCFKALGYVDVGKRYYIKKNLKLRFKEPWWLKFVPRAIFALHHRIKNYIKFEKSFF